MLYTVCETPVFTQKALEIWTNQEKEDYIGRIAGKPYSGEVIPNSGGLRKVRWHASGRGKRGGARVIYYNLLEAGEIVLLMVYTKNKFDDLPKEFYKILKEAVDALDC